MGTRSSVSDLESILLTVLVQTRIPVARISTVFPQIGFPSEHSECEVAHNVRASHSTPLNLRRILGLG